MRTAGSRRMRARALLAVVAAASLALAGCAAPADPSPTKTPADAAPDTTTTPEPTPLTEDDALDIAVETYERFLSVEGDVFDDGGASIGEMENIVTDNMADYVEGLKDSATQDDFTVSGSIQVARSELQDFDNDSISFYACLDFSESSMVDSNGQPVGGDRASAFEAKEVRVVRDGDAYLIDKASHWDDETFCE